MALSFNQSAGGAKKSNINGFQIQEGENKVRLVGDILARYVYWIPGKNGKNIPFECLSFSREEERFTNQEKDWVREFHPDLKSSWSYAMQCIHDGEVKVFNLKKKLFEQIKEVAGKHLGDPTDPETGWDVVFTKKKTGPHAFNVEYTLDILACKNRPLSDGEKELISELKSMDVVMARPTEDAQRKLLEEIRDEQQASGSSEVDDDIEKEFAVS